MQHGKTYASLGKDDDVLEIGANRAIDLIITKEQMGSARGGNTAPGREIGVSPELGKIVAKAGRYGAYVTNGKINATLPKDVTGDSITLDDAIALLKARAASGGGKKGKSKEPSVGEGDRALGKDDMLGTIVAKSGRYGSYVTNGTINATIPKEFSIESITLDDAANWLRAKTGSDAAPKKAAKKTAVTRQGTGERSGKKVCSQKNVGQESATQESTGRRKRQPKKAHAKKQAS